jgi:hypothetical protein
LNPIELCGASDRKQTTLEIMKPVPLTPSYDRQRDSFDRTLGKCRRSPITDFSYDSGAFEDSSAHCAPVHVRSFWTIGGDYFKRESRQDFRREAALFAIITITAALPLINNLHALIEFVRATTFH